MGKDGIRKRLAEELDNYNDVIITLPKTVKWEDYEKELETIKDGTQVMNFKVNHLPKTKEGCKCYLVHDGYIRGWMTIVGLVEDDFTCTTTGKEWSGKFIQRAGQFNYIDPIPMKGFRGFRYMK